MSQYKVEPIVPVSNNWLRLITYCRRVIPHGDISIRIANGEPVDLLSEKRKVRFDKVDKDLFPEIDLTN